MDSIQQQEADKLQVKIRKQRTLTKQATLALYEKLAGPKKPLKSVSPKRSRKKFSPKKKCRPMSPLISASAISNLSSREGPQLPKIAPLDPNQPIFPTNLPELN